MADEATQTTVDEAVETETSADQSTVDAPNNEPEIEGAEALGDPGKKALDAMKAAKKAAELEARTTREELAALKAQVEGKEKEYAAEQERRNVEAAALSKANERILKAEIRAAAASKLSDPADALKFLDLSGFEVGDDGEVDSSAIAEAIDGL